MDAQSTLHLPRILCLHGGGTNARIFRLQCRKLEKSLAPYFRLVFAEAPFPAQPGPDVTSVYKDYGPFKAWLRVRPHDPVLDAHHVVEQIEASLDAARIADDLQGATGEWVGLLGFSQGAKLAASILANQHELRQRRGDGFETVYQFGVLLAGRGPLVWLRPDLPMPRTLVDAAQSTTDIPNEQDITVAPIRSRLKIPTIHVHGLADPGLHLHRKLLRQYFNPNYTALVQWDGNHRVPIKAKHVQSIVEEILLVAQQIGVGYPVYIVP